MTRVATAVTTESECSGTRRDGASQPTLAMTRAMVTTRAAHLFKQKNQLMNDEAGKMRNRRERTAT